MATKAAEERSSFGLCDAAVLRTILVHHVDRAFVDEACDVSAIAKAAPLAV